jgi:uncharacterized protein (TIGR02246 family)
MSETERHNPEEPALLAVIEVENAAWNAGNAIAFAERALPDVVHTNLVGRFAIGKAAFIAQHEYIFSTLYRNSRLQQTLAHLHMLRPDVAVVHTVCELSGYVTAPPGVQPVDGVIRTRLEQVMVREDNGWWVASFHNVAVNPILVPPLWTP